MDVSDDYEEKIANKIEDIHELEVEALRRAGVAKEKEQGLEIESTEAVRLFREATGYILRLRELREDIESLTEETSYPHTERVIGYMDDYNRILTDIRQNNSFKNCVSSFEDIKYSKQNIDGGRRAFYKINIEGRTESVSLNPKPVEANPIRGSKGKKGDKTAVQMVLPRLARLTKEVENSLIGRCASGKRP